MFVPLLFAGCALENDVADTGVVAESKAIEPICSVPVVLDPKGRSPTVSGANVVYVVETPKVSSDLWMVNHGPDATFGTADDVKSKLTSSMKQNYPCTPRLSGNTLAYFHGDPGFGQESVRLLDLSTSPPKMTEVVNNWTMMTRCPVRPGMPSNNFRSDIWVDEQVGIVAYPMPAGGGVGMCDLNLATNKPGSCTGTPSVLTTRTPTGAVAGWRYGQGSAGAIWFNVLAPISSEALLQPMTAPLPWPRPGKREIIGDQFNNTFAVSNDIVNGTINWWFMNNPQLNGGVSAPPSGSSDQNPRISKTRAANGALPVVWERLRGQDTDVVVRSIFPKTEEAVLQKLPGVTSYLRADVDGEFVVAEAVGNTAGVVVSRCMHR